MVALLKRYSWIFVLGIIGFAVGAIYDPVHIKVGVLAVSGTVLLIAFLQFACEYVSGHWQDFV